MVSKVEFQYQKTSRKLLLLNQNIFLQNTTNIHPPPDSNPRSHLEAQLQVLSAPDIEALVICAEGFEPLSVYGEQSPGHGGGGHRLRGVRVEPLLPVRDRVPVELKRQEESVGVSVCAGRGGMVRSRWQSVRVIRCLLQLCEV